MSKLITAYDIDGDTYKIDKKELSWRPSAYGIVIKDNKVLLLKLKGKPDWMALPGGGIEFGETLDEAVEREVKEETGLTVKAGQLLDVKTSFFKREHAGKPYIHGLMIYFTCDYISGDISTSGFDAWEQDYAETAVWLPLNKLNEINLASSIDFRPYIKKVANL